MTRSRDATPLAPDRAAVRDMTSKGRLSWRLFHFESVAQTHVVRGTELTPPSGSKPFGSRGGFVAVAALQQGRCTGSAAGACVRAFQGCGMSRRPSRSPSHTSTSSARSALPFRSYGVCRYCPYINQVS